MLFLQPLKDQKVGTLLLDRDSQQKGSDGPSPSGVNSGYIKGEAQCFYWFVPVMGPSL